MHDPEPRNAAELSCVIAALRAELDAARQQVMAVERTLDAIDAAALGDVSGYLIAYAENTVLQHVKDAVAERDRTIAALREALTPSVETKREYSGEFSFSIDEVDEDGNEYYRGLTVPWTTIKEIMAAIKARAALAPATESEGKHNGA